MSCLNEGEATGHAEWRVVSGSTEDETEGLTGGGESHEIIMHATG